MVISFTSVSLYNSFYGVMRDFLSRVFGVIVLIALNLRPAPFVFIITHLALPTDRKS